jgi:hypothetical protein
MAEPYLTMAEIEKTYPNQWVLIDRPKKGKSPEIVLGGYVIYHGPDKVALEGRVKDLPKPYDIAVWYTGPLTEEGVEYLLNVDWNDE